MKNQAEIRRQRSRDWYYANKARALETSKRNYRKQRRIKLYGVQPEQYNEMLERQGGGCAICGGTNPSGRQLSVDHNHTTKQVRALLCSACNFGVGHFKERSDLLRKAADYLEMFDPCIAKQ